MNIMKIGLMPRTVIGKCSTGLIIAFFLFFAVFWIMIALGQRGGDTFFSNLALTIPMLLAGVSSISAMVIGIIGIVRSRERSILVFLATVIGFIVSIFVLGEILFPH